MSSSFDIDGLRKALNSFGWFIPPYLTLTFLQSIRTAIETNPAFDQDALGKALSLAYSPQHLAAMVSVRYPETPYVQDYKGIISEAVESHLLGLDHVAVTGLMPVIEGSGRRLARSRSLPVTDDTPIKAVFAILADDCVTQVIGDSMGVVHEFVVMIESFVEYAKKFFYVSSSAYPLADLTNRHGTLHGAYADKDYGTPINFYKTIAAVDFLCTIAAFRSPISMLAPSPTEASVRLAAYFEACAALSQARPG